MTINLVDDCLYRWRNYYPMVWDWTDEWKERDFEGFMQWYLESELCSIVIYTDFSFSGMVG
jgi:hypothetical protein